MNKIIGKIITSLLLTILVSCGSNQTDTVETQLSTGVSTSTTSANFGKAASAAEITAMSEKLGTYFNGKNANNPQALTGIKSAIASVNAASTDTPMIAASNVASPVFRFYNVNTGAHFFTMSAAERDYVKTTFPFFNFEGNSFFAYPDSDPTLSPVYRFYNKVTGTHFFTISAEEKAYVQATWPDIFNFEGISWYASADVRTGWVPVYRFFNTKTSTHFYTTSAAERDYVQATWSWFTFEGIAYYVLEGVPPPNNDFSLIANGSGGNYDKTECVKDTATGLVWEGKPLDGVRKWSNTYSNYDSTSELQIYEYPGPAVAPTLAQVNADTNSIGYKNAVNASNLCGFSNWRIPTKEELQGLVRPNTNVYPPFATIDNYWFPNTNNWSYISSTPVVHTPAYPDDPRYSWGVWFNYGDARNTDYRRGCCSLVGGHQNIRLVR